MQELLLAYNDIRCEEEWEVLEAQIEAGHAPI